MPSIAPGLIWALVIAFLALSIGAGVRQIGLLHSSPKIVQKHRHSLGVWWLLTFLFGSALVGGRLGLAILFFLFGAIAIVEFHRIFARRAFESPILAWCIGILGLVHYATLALSNASFAIWLSPVVGLLLLSVVEIGLGRTQNYLRSTAGYFWAYVLLIVGPSHVVLMTSLPSHSDRSMSMGGVEWCIYAVVLTEINDIAQAIVGRQFGKHKITAISPGKTWEGLMGGVFVTTLLSCLLAPFLTTWDDRYIFSASAGILIAISGFLGDLNMSALKREAGVKDSSHLLPGMGGMIDRIDSLSYAAPVFYLYARAFAN